MHCNVKVRTAGAGAAGCGGGSGTDVCRSSRGKRDQKYRVHNSAGGTTIFNINLARISRCHIVTHLTLRFTFILHDWHIGSKIVKNLCRPTAAE